jgi:hydrogenase expression/formation protein HypD
MKYVDEYRDGARARDIAGAIAAEVRPDRSYAFMEFCGGHTHAIARYGIEDLLPANVRLIHGPGCPVCVLPVGRIDDAIALSRLARPGSRMNPPRPRPRKPAQDLFGRKPP